MTGLIDNGLNIMENIHNKQQPPWVWAGASAPGGQIWKLSFLVLKWAPKFEYLINSWPF